MPTLKQLTCHVEWANSRVPFHEHATSYEDGVVTSYIAVPTAPTPFCINLKSSGYIASGLAMFVFMDGVYQCNRNRDDLVSSIGLEKADKKAFEVNFSVRQKEEKLPDDGWIGRTWRFEPLQIGKQDPATQRT